MMLTAIILGIVEGLTEFLPISSTGHLILVGHLLDYTGPKADTFEIFIQLGAILAVIWLYFGRFKSLFNFKSADGFEGKNGLILLALTSLPAFILGFLLHDYIKEHLFKPSVVAVGLAVGGIAIIWLERHPRHSSAKNLDQITKRQALRIGFVQVLALWPGVSRSAATILGGMNYGLNRETAVQYSFLAAVPVILAATGYDLIKSLPDLNSSDFGFFAVGFITAFITALFSIKLFLRFVQTSNLIPFGWYRLAVAFLVLVFLVI